MSSTKASSGKKRPRSEIISKEGEDSTDHPGVNDQSSNQNHVLDAKLMWEKLCLTYQRLLLAKAVQEKLSDSQIREPDATKGKLLKGLNEEVIMLSFVKSQLEEAMTKYFSNEISLPKPTDNSIFSIIEDNNALGGTSSTFPLTNLVTPVTMPPKENEPLPFLTSDQTASVSTTTVNENQAEFSSATIIIPNSPTDPNTQ
jgi:hypothetical protein